MPSLAGGASSFQSGTTIVNVNSLILQDIAANRITGNTLQFATLDITSNLVVPDLLANNLVVGNVATITSSTLTIDGNTRFIGNVVSANLVAGVFAANVATAADLGATRGNVGNLTSALANLANLTATTATISSLSATSANVAGVFFANTSTANAVLANNIVIGGNQDFRLIVSNGFGKLAFNQQRHFDSGDPGSIGVEMSGNCLIQNVLWVGAGASDSSTAKLKLASGLSTGQDASVDWGIGNLILRCTDIPASSRVYLERLRIGRTGPFLFTGGNLNLASAAQAYHIAGTSVLSTTTLGNSVVNSNLSSLGANLLVANVATQRVGIGVPNPAYALDVNGITGALQVFAKTNIVDSQNLAQGLWLGWNHNGGTGTGQIVNKSGAGGGGVIIFDTSGDGSRFDTNRVEIANIGRTQMTVPGPLFARCLTWRATRQNFSITDSAGSIQSYLRFGTVDNRFATNPVSGGGNWFPPFTGIYSINFVGRFGDGAGTYGYEPWVNTANIYGHRLFAWSDGSNRRFATWNMTMFMNAALSFDVILFMGSIGCSFLDLSITFLGTAV
jgi:hypothetical protein